MGGETDELDEYMRVVEQEAKKQAAEWCSLLLIIPPSSHCALIVILTLLPGEGGRDLATLAFVRIRLTYHGSLPGRCSRPRSEKKEADPGRQKSMAARREEGLQKPIGGLIGCIVTSATLGGSLVQMSSPQWRLYSVISIDSSTSCRFLTPPPFLPFATSSMQTLKTRATRCWR